MVSPYILPVPYINCQMPVALALDTALGFNADSIIEQYFNSSGMS